MASVVNKLWNMINMNAETAEEEYDAQEEYAEIEYPEESGTIKGLFGRKNNVASIQQPVRMVILQPTNFEQAEEICDLLKDRKSIIINLEYVNKDVARRIIAIYAKNIKFNILNCSI